MSTIPISAPVDPVRFAAPTDQAGSDAGWAIVTGTVANRRPEPLDKDAESRDAAFTEAPGSDGPSLAPL